ncbi:hypothetical protein [Kingella oralis]|uniref:hypothetical protein n=2 Tax=Kingella oralis TaxID=505 RepID=UPI002D7F611B|nr:hypothetical protein [Kingella oralis]
MEQQRLVATTSRVELGVAHRFPENVGEPPTHHLSAVDRINKGSLKTNAASFSEAKTFFNRHFRFSGCL